MWPWKVFRLLLGTALLWVVVASVRRLSDTQTPSPPAPDSSPDCPGSSVLELDSLPSAGCCFVLSLPPGKPQLPPDSPTPALSVFALKPRPGHGALSVQFSWLALKMTKPSYRCICQRWPLHPHSTAPPPPGNKGLQGLLSHNILGHHGGTEEGQLTGHQSSASPAVSSFSGQ